MNMLKSRLPSLHLAVVLIAVCLAATGCSRYQYAYVLEVRCEGTPIPGKPGFHALETKPPVTVTIECDGEKERAQFDPYGETKTLRFSEKSRVMIDGAAIVRGFSVRAQRPGYKDWAADYKHLDHLMSVADLKFIRLDSVLLVPLESPEPSRRLKGGPHTIER
jgi:hypothetical protein